MIGSRQEIFQNSNRILQSLLVNLLKSNFSMNRILPLLLTLAIAGINCHPKVHVTSVKPGYVEMNKSTGQTDSATHSILAPYKLGMDSIMNEVVGETTEAMPKERDKCETLLGNFVSDVCLEKGNAGYKPEDDRKGQVCILNNGGLRSSLPKGIITRGNIFELMPFDNELVVLTISGNKMWDLLKYVAASGGVPVAGMKMGLKSDKTPGVVLINGVPFDSTKTYKVVTSDYLASGGDKMSFLKDPIQYETTGVRIRDGLLEYCTERKKQGIVITPKLDGRVYYESD